MIRNSMSAYKSDFLNVLVETSDGDEGSMKELQYIYDVLRKMDRKNDGKLDPDALRAARDREFGISKIESITLYRSHLGPAAASYEALATFLLQPR